MSERIHSTPLPTKTDHRRRLVLLAAGTAAAVLVAAVAIQMFRADDLPAQVAPAGGSGQARVTGTRQPLARVNDQLIPWESVANECMLRYGKEVLDNFINREIIQQACAEQGLVVTAEEVDAEIRRIATRFKLAPDQWLQMLEAERNLTPLQYRRDVIWPMLALKKIAGDDVKVTREDLEQAFLRDYGERVNCKMILMDNLRRANEVWAEARRNPGEFERLAQEHSIDRISASQGGQIPPIRRFSGNKELEEMAFGLRDGEISPVKQVAPNERWVILKCEGRTKQVVTDIREVEEVLYEQVLEERVQQSVAKVFERLKTRARVDNFLTNVSTGGVQQVSGQNAGGS
ncbi:MAG TPA: peptidylprolyl isomerase, partial [Planctomycetaceae bacterium]|nr:peptidylprolyl isomerase [Planctomycetaceae bacterium]